MHSISTRNESFAIEFCRSTGRNYIGGEVGEDGALIPYVFTGLTDRQIVQTLDLLKRKHSEGISFRILLQGQPGLIWPSSTVFDLEHALDVV